MYKKLAVVIFTVCSIAIPAFAQEKDFHDKDLTGKSFHGASLNGADFSDAVLQNCEFTGASLKKANFNGADLKNASMARADMTGADLRGISQIPYIDTTILNEANLEGVDMKACGSIYGCKFRKANLKNTKGWNLIGACDFSGADLRGANFRGMTPAPNARFNKAVYDEDTTWPDGFDPASVGAIMSTGESHKKEGSRDASSKSSPSED